MQHDRSAWTETLKLFSITQLTYVKQDHKISRAAFLSVQMDNTSPSTSVLTSSCYSINFQVLLSLQPLPCFARRPELFCSPSFSTDSNTCIKALAEYEGRSTSHLGILFLCLDFSKGDGLEGKYLCWRKMKNVSHGPENRLRLFLENKLQSS